MKMKLMATTMAALAVAAALQTAAKAEDPISPVQGAVCNLYYLNVPDAAKAYSETAAVLAQKPAAATFVDAASDFKASKKRSDVQSSWGMWTGWLKQEKAGTYTFLCKRSFNYNDGRDGRYSIWINGVKCLECTWGQSSFNVDLNAGFNSVKIIAVGYSNEDRPLSITYKKAGSVKDPVSFGPADMWYDDEE